MTTPLVAHSSHQLVAADGTNLFVSDYLLPPSAARGSVVLMHGIGEHSGRYRRLAEWLNHCKLSVRCYDHRGHGRSGGARGDVPNGTPMVQDAQIVIDDFARRVMRPPYLFGHSMGGLLATHVALSRVCRLRGLVLSSPALALTLSGLQRALVNGLLALAPRFGIPHRLPLKYLSHEAGVIAAYKADPLVHSKISARLLKAMLASMAYCQANASTLSVPLLMQVAGDDRLVDADGSRRFFAGVPGAGATMKIYDGYYHEIFNDTGADKPLADLRAWLSAHDVP